MRTRRLYVPLRMRDLGALGEGKKIVYLRETSSLTKAEDTQTARIMCVPSVSLIGLSNRMPSSGSCPTSSSIR